MSATPRRSARVAASRTASADPTPAPQTGSQRGTASRKSTPRSQELPALPSKTSTTYGGVAQNELPEGQPSGPASSLASMLQTQREEVAKSMESRANSPPKPSVGRRGTDRGASRSVSGGPSQTTSTGKASKGRTSSRSTKKSTADLPQVAEDDEDEAYTGPPSAVAQPGHQANLPANTGMFRPEFTNGKHVDQNASTESTSGQSTSSRKTTRTFNESDLFEGPIEVEDFPKVRDSRSGDWKRFFITFVIMFSFLMTWKFVIPKSATSGVTDFVNDVTFYPRAAVYSIGNSFRSAFATEVVYVPWDVARDYEKKAKQYRQEIDYEIRQLKESRHLSDKYLDDMFKILPNVVHLTKSETGEVQLPPDLWTAMESKLEQSLGKDSGERFKSFWDKNNERIAAYVEKSHERLRNDPEMAEAIFNKDILQEMITKKHYKLESSMTDLKEHVRWGINRIDKEVIENAKNAAVQQANIYLQKAMSVSPAQGTRVANENVQFDTFHLNMWHSLENVNFFSPSLGAVVNPFLTSPTIDWYQINGELRYKGPGILSRARPPIAALEPWFEAGDCWCGASSPHAQHPADPQPKLQLGVQMPTNVYPTTFVLDQIPETGTIDSDSAPRDLELWVEIKDEGLRESTWRRFFDTNPGHGITTDDMPFDPDDVPNVSQSKTIGTVRGGELPETYVLIGQFEAKNSMSTNYARYFDLQIHDGYLAENNWFVKNKFSVRNAVVRVTENHGKEYTCIYRVRLEGYTLKMLQSRGELKDDEVKDHQ
ncbi:MAG: hypothetical protein M1831_002743 [Alyxoria varia]|nr:MAG: hypothetical protein M1831_002743 [Alyxoria varia]